MNKKIITRFVYPITILILLVNCIFHIVNSSFLIKLGKCEGFTTFTSSYFAISFSIILNIALVVIATIVLYILINIKYNSKSKYFKILSISMLILITLIFAYNLTNYISQLQSYNTSIEVHKTIIEEINNENLISIYKDIISNYQNLKLASVLLIISSSMSYIVLILNILIWYFSTKRASHHLTLPVETE